MLKPLQIGPIQLPAPVMLAPMTGISDVPFRNLVQSFGAPLVFSEMVAGKEQLRGTAQSDRMASFEGTARPHAIQLAGRDPKQMAEAAKLNADRGVDLIDINFGCPAKKVVGGLGGSAIMRDEILAGQILDAVVRAVDLPVTLKIRLGWDDQSRNAARIAKIAENAGIQSLTVHGRTRAQFYEGQADWHAIAEVRDATSLPLIANGDISGAKTAREALHLSGADGIMVGRASVGQPWLPALLAAELTGRPKPHIPHGDALITVIRQHLNAMMSFYGELMGLRIARKHMAEYLRVLSAGDGARAVFNRIDTADEAYEFLEKLSAAPMAA